MINKHRTLRIQRAEDGTLVLTLMYTIDPEIHCNWGDNQTDKINISMAYGLLCNIRPWVAVY